MDPSTWETTTTHSTWKWKEKECGNATSLVLSCFKSFILPLSSKDLLLTLEIHKGFMIIHSSSLFWKREFSREDGIPAMTKRSKPRNKRWYRNKGKSRETYNKQFPREVSQGYKNRATRHPPHQNKSNQEDCLDFITNESNNNHKIPIIIFLFI